jgi:hypothetical protein
MHAVDASAATHRSPGRSKSLALAVSCLLPALLALVPLASQACATCGCTLSKDWLGGQATGSPGWSMGLSYDLIDQNQFRQGTSSLTAAQANFILTTGANAAGYAAGATEVETMTLTRTSTLNLDYNAPDWGVSLQLPFVDRYHLTYHGGLYDPASGQFNPNNSADLSHVNSMGDLRVVSRISLTEDGSFGLNLGLKLPTGQTNAVFARSGQPIDPSLQSGTGSTDLILGAFAAHQVEDFGFFAQGQWQHALSEQAPSGNPDQSYRPGDAFSATLGARWNPLGQQVVPLLQLNVTRRNQDSGPGASTEADGAVQSGGTLVYLAPGVSAMVGKGFRAYAYVQIPVYQNVNNVQLVPREILSLGVRKSF